MKISAAVLVLLALPIHAQPLVESIEVRVTNVDVVVTDRAGNPVTGLTKDDFEILEDGKPQPVTNFYEVTASPSVAAPAAPAGGAPPPAVPAEVSKRRIVVFVDNFSISPLLRNQAMRALEQSLDTLMRPGDEAMLVSWDRGMSGVSPMTADRAELVRRLHGSTSKSAGGARLESMKEGVMNGARQYLSQAGRKPQIITYQDAYKYSMASANSYADFLWGVERALHADVRRMISTLAGFEGKKILLYLGAELPESPGVELFRQIDALYGPFVKDTSVASLKGQDRKLGEELREVARHANANGVTMYMVDSGDRRRSLDASSGEAADPEADYLAESNTKISMTSMAAITGGISVPGGKSFETALGTIARDLSSYYSLGYRPPDGTKADRRIVVRVKKPGLSVRSRTSYVTKSVEDDIRDRVIANLFNAPGAADFAVQISAAAPQPVEGGKYRVPLTITFPSSMTLLPQGNMLKGEFAVYFATGNERGGMSNVTTAVQPMQFPAGSESQIAALRVFTYAVPLMVGKGEQTVSVAVQDRVGGTRGFATTKVDVR